jgi:hypothetical protein
MDRSELEETIFGKGVNIPRAFGDKILVLNMRQAHPKYPEAVPISKETGFMFPSKAKEGDVGRFILHRHEAKRAGLHHDLRIEIGGQLQSFALPQQLPTGRGNIRLGIGPTAHHRLEYYQKGSYTIPEPFYGAGKMSTDDIGTAVLESIKDDHITVRLHGVSGLADGTYTLVKYNPKGEVSEQQQWLIQKVRPLQERDPLRAKRIYTERIGSKEQKIFEKLSRDYSDFIDRRQYVPIFGREEWYNNWLKEKYPQMVSFYNELANKHVKKKDELAEPLLTDYLNEAKPLGFLASLWVAGAYDPETKSLGIDPKTLDRLEKKKRAAEKVRHWFNLFSDQLERQKRFMWAFEGLGHTAGHEFTHRNVDRDIGNIWEISRRFGKKSGYPELKEKSEEILFKYIPEYAVQKEMQKISWLDRLLKSDEEIAELKKYLDEGEFPAGSMGPKIEATMKFLEDGGKEVLITSVENYSFALQGKTGTKIVP